MTDTQTTKTIWPSLVYADARGAIRFLVDTFGFEQRIVVPEGDGPVVHSELRWPEGGGVMISSADRGGDDAFSTRPAGTGSCYVVTDRPDELYARALEARVEVVREIYDADYGSRGFSIRDSEGNLWSFGTYRGT
jgi:uncharacterized glyoxalase superfamily protein PhnB